MNYLNCCKKCVYLDQYINGRLEFNDHLDCMSILEYVNNSLSKYFLKKARNIYVCHRIGIKTNAN